MNIIMNMDNIIKEDAEAYEAARYSKMPMQSKRESGNKKSKRPSGMMKNKFKQMKSQEAIGEFLTGIQQMNNIN
jgi:hypothetical protein